MGRQDRQVDALSVPEGAAGPNRAAKSDPAAGGDGSGATFSVCLYFYSLAQRGGAERMTLWLAERLAERGHRVVIITLDTPGADSAFPVPAAVTWRQLDRRGSWRGKVQRIRDMERILRQVRADVLIGFVMAADKTVYAAALSAGTPLIAAERNDPVIFRDRMRWPQRALTWLSLRLCRRIAVQLPVYRDGYPWFLRRRVAVIPNPVAPAPQHAGSGAEQGGVIVALGRLHHQKGFDLLLDAFKEVLDAEPGWRLRIVGDGPERQALLGQADRLGVASAGPFVPDLAEPGAELHDADVFAFSSRYEGFPNALAEAMSRGLPCVAFASCKGAAALLEHGQAGELAHPGESAPAFALALSRVMAQPEYRRRLGMRAREATRAYTDAEVSERWAELIASAVP